MTTYSPSWSIADFTSMFKSVDHWQGVVDRIELSEADWDHLYETLKPAGRFISPDVDAKHILFCGEPVMPSKTQPDGSAKFYVSREGVDSIEERDF
jgi:hypothetical protein